MVILIISLLVYFCFCTFKEFLKVPPHLLISGRRPFHSYGPLIWNMNDFHEFLLLFWYHQKFSHYTSVVTCRVCISPRAHQDNKVITIQSLGYTQSNPILYTWFGRKPSKFLKNGCDVNMAWALSVKNDVINEVCSSLSSRRLSISLNTRIQMCIRLRALVLSMVLIGLKCVVYLASCLSPT